MTSLISRLLPAAERRVARQTLWMGAITAVQFLGGLAQVTISARILGPEGYGVLAVIIAVTLLMYGLLVTIAGALTMTWGLWTSTRTPFAICAEPGCSRFPCSGRD